MISLKASLFNKALGLTLIFSAADCAYGYKIGNVDMKLQASINQAYDDNITYAGQNVKRDFVTGLTAGISALYESKTFSYSLRAALRQEVFARHSAFDNTSEYLNAGASKEFSKYDRMSITYAFIHATEPRSLEDQFGGTGTRFSYYKNFFNAQYSRDVTKQLTLLGSYQNEYYDYSRRDLTDSVLNSGGVEADYFLSSRTVLLGLLSYMKRHFDGAGNVDTKRAAGGIRQYLTNQAFADIRIGRDFTRSVDNQETSGQFTSLSLTNDLDENTRAGISYVRQNSTTSYSRDIFKSQRVSLYLNRRLLSRLGVSASVFYGDGKYSASNVKDKFKGVNIGLVYDFWHNAAADISYGYSALESNDSSRDYKKNLVSFGITVKF